MKPIIESIVPHGNNFLLYHCIIAELIDKFKQVNDIINLHYFKIFWLLENALGRD